MKETRQFYTFHVVPGVAGPAGRANVITEQGIELVERESVSSWTRVTSALTEFSRSFDTRTRYGVELTVDVQSISGTGATVEVTVERSIDGLHWTAIEGAGAITSAQTVYIERHWLGQKLRVKHAISGTSPDIVFRIDLLWLEDADYSASKGGFNVAWDSSPLSSSTSETFVVSGPIPGLTVAWTATYYDSGSSEVGTESGTGTLDVNGTFNGSSFVPAGASGGTATLSVRVVKIDLDDASESVL